MFINFKSKTNHLLFATTLLSLLFNVFFILSHWGISVIIFNGVLLGVTYFTLRDQPQFNPKQFFVCAGLLIILAIPFARFDFELFKVINTLLMVLVYVFLVNGVFELNLAHIIRDLFLGVFTPFSRIHLYTKDSAQKVLKNDTNFIKILLGLLFAGLVFVVVLPLLLSSDTVFNATLDNAFGFMDFIEVDEVLLRMFFFFLFGSYLYAQFGHKPLPLPKVEAQKNLSFFDPVIANVFLVCIDLVYVLFSYIQIKYLFMGNVLPDEMNYSEYARQGFFQLVFVTAINILMIIVFNKFKQHRVMTNALLVITLLCTYIMTFSAFKRMALYESTFGFTRLRFLVDLFLIAEVIALIPIFIGILRPKIQFLEIAFLTLFVYYLGITFINVDAFVADKNIQMYRDMSDSSAANQDFDIDYLDTLSKDVLPKLAEFIDTADDETALYFKETILLKYLNSYYEAKWYEFNFSNQKTADLYGKFYPLGHDENNIPTHYRSPGLY